MAWTSQQRTPSHVTACIVSSFDADCAAAAVVVVDVDVVVFVFVVVVVIHSKWFTITKTMTPPLSCSPYAPTATCNTQNLVSSFIPEEEKPKAVSNCSFTLTGLNHGLHLITMVAVAFATARVVCLSILRTAREPKVLLTYTSPAWVWRTL